MKKVINSPRQVKDKITHASVKSLKAPIRTRSARKKPLFTPKHKVKRQGLLSRCSNWMNGRMLKSSSSSTSPVLVSATIGNGKYFKGSKMGNIPIMPIMTRNKKGQKRQQGQNRDIRDKLGRVGTSRNKTGTIRDKTGTKRNGRDNTGTSRDITGTVIGKARKTKILDYTKFSLFSLCLFCPCFFLYWVVPSCPCFVFADFVSVLSLLFSEISRDSPCLSLYVPFCPCMTPSVPFCPCLSLSVPVCLYICYTSMSTPGDEYNSLH